MYTDQFNSIKILQAYKKAIDANIITTITDVKGVILYVNSKFCEVTMYAEKEVIGQKHNIINSGYHPKDFFKDMWQTIGHGHVWNKEIKNKAKDGSFYWVDTVILPIVDEHGKITYYLSLRTLITEKKELERKKENYVSSLESLLVMTSNNVKKPILNCLKQIKSFDLEKKAGKKELKEILENLKLSADELDNFSNELNTFIREMDRK
jgi:PAS domain S-box-containing protein